MEGRNREEGPRKKKQSRDMEERKRQRRKGAGDMEARVG